MEQWCNIPGYEFEYQVSDIGNIGSKRSGKLLVPYFAHDYLQVSLSSGGYVQQFKVHRIVLISFKGIDLKRQVANHINGIKTDNRLINLEWTTQSENLLHSSRILHNNSKLTMEDVSVIRTLCGSISQCELARRYKVSPVTISKIVRGKSWIF